MTRGVGIQQLGVLLIAAAMIAIGSLGLSGTLTAGPILVSLLVLTAVLLAFSLGKRRGEQQSQEEARAEARRA